MRQVALYSRSGVFVAKVALPFPAEVIAYGWRMFIRQANGSYREATLFTAPLPTETPAPQG